MQPLLSPPIYLARDCLFRLHSRTTIVRAVVFGRSREKERGRYRLLIDSRSSDTFPTFLRRGRFEFPRLVGPCGYAPPLSRTGSAPHLLTKWCVDMPFHRHSRQPQFESLENRQLLTAVVSNNVLTIVGTKLDDTIQVQTVSGQFQVHLNGQVSNFSNVNTIVINALAGNDQITVDDNVTVPVRINGGKGDDTIKGGAGGDTLIGGSGNDTIHGSGGADSISGGKGDDLIYGDAGDDAIYGDAGNDHIEAGDGDDSCIGGAGDDFIDGGDGNDHLAGNAGNDELHGGLGIDQCDGGIGNDIVTGDDGNDLVLGGAGTDSVDGGNGADYCYGGDGDDTLIGGPGNDHLFGQAGNDHFQDDDGDDVCYGGPGNDVFDGGAGNDLYFGEAGNDTINGGPGDDQIEGGPGNDICHGGDGDDQLRGGPGIDQLDGDSGNNLLDADTPKDILAHGLSADLNEEVLAYLGHQELGGSGNGVAGLNVQNENGVIQKKFTLTIQGVHPFNSALSVHIDGQLVGQIATDATGNGELVFSTNPTGTESPFPSNFPHLTPNSTIQIAAFTPAAMGLATLV